LNGCAAATVQIPTRVVLFDGTSIHSDTSFSATTIVVMSLDITTTNSTGRAANASRNTTAAAAAHVGTKATDVAAAVQKMQSVGMFQDNIVSQ
jgi:hypothetical protein